MVGLAGNDSVHQRENSPREAGGGEGGEGEGETLPGEGAGRGGRHLAEEEEN